MAITRIPPNNTEAESAVLGALLIDHEAINTVSGQVKPEYFYDGKNAIIFEACLALFEERKPIDLLTLTSALKANKKYDVVGGSTYLASLTNSVPTAANIDHYIALMKEAYVRRTIIRIAAEMTDLSFSQDTAEELLDHVEQNIFSLSQESIKQDFIHIKDALTQSFDKLDELHRSGSHLIYQSFE